MTKEEAIMNLQHTVNRMNKEKGNVIKELDRNGKTVDILCSKEALEMGIEALKRKSYAKWINPVYDLHNLQQCSRCGYTTSAKSRFCPGCGAEMEVEE